MANIIWSLTNGGASISSNIDHGTVGNGDESSATQLFVRHDGASNLTSVGLYVRQFSGNYAGSFTSAADFAELLAWGDGDKGFRYNLNATGSYPTADWASFKTGSGDSEANAITLPTTTGASASGTLQTGSSPNVRLSTKVVIPSNEDTVGIRQFSMVLRFTATS